MAEQILVIGATLLDSRGKPTSGLAPGTSNTAHIRVTRGGTARNVAENLGRLGADVCLISAVGNDLMGHSLVSQTAESGVDTEFVQVMDGENTGAYIAVLEENGGLSVAMDDVQVMRHITSGYLDRQRTLFKKADLVIHPDIIPPVGVLEFRHKRRCAAAGTRAVLRSRADIRRLTRRREPGKHYSTRPETQDVTKERNRP